MVIEESIIGGEMDGARSTRETKMITSLFLKIPTNNTRSFEDVKEVRREKEADCGKELLRRNSLSTWPYFLETFMKLRLVQAGSCHSMSAFKPLHNLHIGISKLAM